MGDTAESPPTRRKRMRVQDLLCKEVEDSAKRVAMEMEWLQTRQIEMQAKNKALYKRLREREKTLVETYQELQETRHIERSLRTKLDQLENRLASVVDLLYHLEACHEQTQELLRNEREKK